jgi:RNA polymerase sigma-70 factor (ECF subfamily)
VRWLKAGTGGGIGEDLSVMRRYARSLARDDQDADDVVQDALVRAIEGQETFQPARGRRQWLLAIVHNVFISGKRREAAEARRNARFAETMVAHLGADQEHRARLTQLAQALAAMPHHHRSVLHLVAVEGLTYQEAAEVLDVPVGTVMSRLARARAALRAQQDGPGEQKLRVVGGQDD